MLCKPIWNCKLMRIILLQHELHQKGHNMPQQKQTTLTKNSQATAINVRKLGTRQRIATPRWTLDQIKDFIHIRIMDQILQVVVQILQVVLILQVGHIFQISNLSLNMRLHPRIILLFIHRALHQLYLLQLHTVHHLIMMKRKKEPRNCIMFDIRKKGSLIISIGLLYLILLMIMPLVRHPLY